MPQNKKQFRYRLSFAAKILLGALATTSSLGYGQEGTESIRLQQRRDLSENIVIGMLTGITDHTKITIRIDDLDYPLSATGNGKPFDVINRSPKIVEILLKRPPGPGTITRVAYRFFNSERSLYQALLLSEVDFAVLSEEAMAHEVVRNNPVMLPTAIAKKTHSIEMIVYNLQHEILKNLEIRKAISFAIRKQDLVVHVIDGVPQTKGEVAKGSVFEPDNEFYPDVAIEEYRHNLRRARDLLESNGWIDRDNDGVREKNGIKLKIKLAYRGGIELEESIARDVLLACNQLGIEIIGEALAASELEAHLSSGKYEAVLSEYTFDESIEAIYNFFTNPQTSFIRFSNESYLTQYKLSQQTSDRKNIIGLAHGMQRTLNNQCVVSFLFFKWYDYAVHNAAKLQNVRDASSSGINPINLWRLSGREK